jgi:sulfatase modifying factor 1
LETAERQSFSALGTMVFFSRKAGTLFPFGEFLMIDSGFFTHRLPTRVFLGAMCVVVSLVAGAVEADAAQVTMSMVTVGNPNNPADAGGYGTVATSYQISKYEVTIGQYVEFLNAVAKTDTNGLWNQNLDSGVNGKPNVRGISRSGADGSYSYAAIGPDGTAFSQSAANRPITYVSWNNAARFANWMANGQPTGSQSTSTTENGAYNLAGASGVVALNATNPNTPGLAPTFALPTSDQWYKAAYYNPTLNGGSGGYYDYATQSDTAPGNAVGGGSNQANVVASSKYSLTQSTTLDTNQNYLTDVGSYTGSASYYGTFDQTGNTSEWTSTAGGTGKAVLRGGAWNLSSSIGAGAGIDTGVTIANYDTGFRLVAPVPEPSTMVLVFSALVGVGCWSWRRSRHQ